MTRLADITGLDRLSLPVWQAVRPAGRALSVHQGKGSTPLGARIGALCEAIESHCAENALPDGPLCPIEALPIGPGGTILSDYSRSRALSPPAGPVQWCEATDLLTGKPVHLPHDLVSLDFTAKGATYFDRSSSGLAVGATEENAVMVSLFELIERDAVGRWQCAAAAERSKRELALDTIPFDWFGYWRERFLGLGISLRVFQLPALARIATFACWITGREEFGTGQRSFSGTSAHASAEIALFKALAEAIQSRLTQIAGTRDDILPSHYALFDLPLAVPARPSGVIGRPWRKTAPRAASAERLAEDLADAGYRRIAVKRLDARLDGIAATKVFVPGLGTSKRSRRRPT